MTGLEVYPGAFTDGRNPTKLGVSSNQRTQHRETGQSELSDTVTGTGWQVGRRAWQQIERSRVRLPRYHEGREPYTGSKTGTPILQRGREHLILPNSKQYRSQSLSQDRFRKWGKFMGAWQNLETPVMQVITMSKLQMEN